MLPSASHQNVVFHILPCRVLSSNKFTLIPSGTFTGLGNLKNLYASIHYHVTTRFFFTYRWCRDLTSNQITSIANDVFTGLASLANLYVTMLYHITMCCFTGYMCRGLSSNMITSIASGTFTGLASLAELYATMRCHFTTWFFEHCYLGTWTAIKSLWLLVAHSLGLQDSQACMLPSMSHHLFNLAYDSRRYMFTNPVTSIAIGAFTGLGSLTDLYVTMPDSFRFLTWVGACLIPHRVIDLLPTTKAPFNMLVGIPITEL